MQDPPLEALTLGSLNSSMSLGFYPGKIQNQSIWCPRQDLAHWSTVGVSMLGSELVSFGFSQTMPSKPFYPWRVAGRVQSPVQGQKQKQLTKLWNTSTHSARNCTQYCQPSLTRTSSALLFSFPICRRCHWGAMRWGQFGQSQTINTMAPWLESRSRGFKVCIFDIV